MKEWIVKEDSKSFWMEASFLTRWGVGQELRRSSFIRWPEDINGLKSYIRYWPDGIHAVARVHPKMGAGRVTVTISYYNNRGRKFRKLPAESE